MENSSRRKAIPKRIKIGVAVIAFAAVILIAGYSDYLHALLRRGFDGDRADFIGHKIRLPIFWFKGDKLLFGESFVGRAYPSYLIWKPAVSATPISPNEVKGTDAEVIERRRAMLKILAEKLDKTKSSTTVDIHSKAFTLYCIKDRLGPIAAALSCRAAGLPFILNYSGPMSVEPEAEMMLSSFE